MTATVDHLALVVRIGVNGQAKSLNGQAKSLNGQAKSASPQ